MRVLVLNPRFLLIAIFAALVTTLAPVSTAEARNVPGSSASGIPILTTAANDMIITDVLGGIRDLNANRAGGGGQKSADVRFVALDPSLTSGALDPHEVNKTSFTSYRGLSAQVMSEGGFGAYAVGHYREIDADQELQSDLFTFGGFLGYQATNNLYVTGGFIGEYSKGTTPFNQGTLDSEGLGAAAGVTYGFANNISLTALGGYYMLSYDVSRSAGAVRGSLDARRYFVDVSADYAFDFDDFDTQIAVGLRYFYQNHDAYIESSGAPVNSFAVSALSATASTKTYFGTDTEFRPFVEANVRANVSENYNAPAGVIILDNQSYVGRFGGGFNYSSEGGTTVEVGVGFNFSENAYNGFDATIRALIPF